MEELRTTSGLRVNATMESDPHKVVEVVAALLGTIEDFIGTQEMADLQLVLCEMLLNAIEHGNLGITSEEKRTALAEGSFVALMQNRRSHPLWGQRSVDIEMTMDTAAREFRCRIRDEGEGFDWRTLLQAPQPEALLQPHGRGIMLSRMTVDRLEYNDKGNEVTLIKRTGTEIEQEG